MKKIAEEVVTSESFTINLEGKIIGNIDVIVTTRETYEAEEKMYATLGLSTLESYQEKPSVIINGAGAGSTLNIN
jgi:hypothetical protein